MRKLTAVIMSVVIAGNLYSQETDADRNVLKKDSTANILSEVVVTGSNLAVGKNLIPYTVSVVGEKELQESGSNQLLTAISGQVPSLFVTERALMGFGVSNGGSGGIKIRGVGDNGSVLMMVDGQPQFAGIYSHHIADFYSKEYVERVEVLRGPGSVLYGSNAMGGVINVITKNANVPGVHAALSSQYGSYNTWLTSLNATANYGKFSALANVSYDRTDGQIKGLKYRQWDGFAKATYRISSNWKTSLDFTLMNFKGEDPVYATLSNPESIDIYYQDVTRGETSLAFFNTYASTNGAARIYYSWGNHSIDDPRHFHSTDDRLGALLYQNLSFKSNTDLTIGFDFNSYSGEIPVSGGNQHTEGSMSTISRKRITEYSPYVTAAQSLFSEQLIISAGLRVANSNMFGTKLVPQAGIVINPASILTIKLSASNGYRNPSFKELYLYRMANPDLKPENMWNYEISVGKHFSRYFQIDVTGYISRGTNMIQVVDMKNENTGKFINKGIDVSASSHPLRNLNISASYSWLHTSLYNLTGAPRTQYFLGADWQIIKPLSVSAEVKGVGGLFVAENIKRQNYALLNIRAEYTFNRYFSLFLRLNNITDARYVINRGYEMPGFNVMGGFQIRI